MGKEHTMSICQSYKEYFWYYVGPANLLYIHYFLHKNNIKSSIGIIWSLNCQNFFTLKFIWRPHVVAEVLLTGLDNGHCALPAHEADRTDYLCVNLGDPYG